MKQKTVRFYEDSPEDVSALQILDEYRKYGFSSAREMIIAAINNYVQGCSISSLGISLRDMDELANKIAMKIINMNVTTSKEVGFAEKRKNENDTANDENYQKALSFMETL